MWAWPLLCSKGRIGIYLHRLHRHRARAGHRRLCPHRQPGFPPNRPTNPPRRPTLSPERGAAIQNPRPSRGAIGILRTYRCGFATAYSVRPQKPIKGALHRSARANGDLIMNKILIPTIVLALMSISPAYAQYRTPSADEQHAACMQRYGNGKCAEVMCRAHSVDEERTCGQR